MKRCFQRGSILVLLALFACLAPRRLWRRPGERRRSPPARRAGAAARSTARGRSDRRQRGWAERDGRRLGMRSDAGGQPRTDASSMPVSASVLQACQTYAGAVCAKLSTCSPAELQADYGDLRTCTARKALACSAGAGAPGAAISAAGLMACVGELAAGACDAFATRGLAACLLPGRRGDGDGCASISSAAPACKRTRGINCGSCTPLGRVGSPCAESPECGAGLECAEIGQCVAPAAVGGACNPSQPCRFGAYCGADNLCAAQVDQSGGPCQARGSCAAQRGLVSRRTAAFPSCSPAPARPAVARASCCARPAALRAGAWQRRRLLAGGPRRRGLHRRQEAWPPPNASAGSATSPAVTDTGFCN